MACSEAIIVDAIRTPVGKYGGMLRDIRPNDLNALTIQTLIQRNILNPAAIQDVLGDARIKPAKIIETSDA